MLGRFPYLELGGSLSLALGGSLSLCFVELHPWGLGIFTFRVGGSPSLGSYSLGLGGNLHPWGWQISILGDRGSSSLEVLHPQSWGISTHGRSPSMDGGPLTSILDEVRRTHSLLHTTIPTSYRSHGGSIQAHTLGQLQFWDDGNLHHEQSSFLPSSQLSKHDLNLFKSSTENMSGSVFAVERGVSGRHGQQFLRYALY